MSIFEPYHCRCDRWRVFTIEQLDPVNALEEAMAFDGGGSLVTKAKACGGLLAEKLIMCEDVVSEAWISRALTKCSYPRQQVLGVGAEIVR